MGDKLDRSKFSLDLQREKRRTPPLYLPELSTISGVVTPLGQAQPVALAPCVLTAQDIQKIAVATPEMDKLLIPLNSTTVGLATATTPPQLVSGNKSLTSDKEDFCKELLQNMEANIKSKTEASTSLPLSEPSSSSTSTVQVPSNAVEILRSLNSIKTVKLPLTGNTPTIILPNSNLAAVSNVSNLIASTGTNSLPYVAKSVSGFKIHGADLLNPVHSAFGSPCPVAIVNPQPHGSIGRKQEATSSLTAASMLFGSAPKIRSSESESSTALQKSIFA